MEKNRDWLEEECTQIIVEKNAAILKYKNLRKESKKIMRRKKREALKNEIREMDVGIKPKE